MASSSSTNKTAPTGILQSSLSPKYLHTNSTSHTWPFSAVAELIDNAYDPDVKASQLWIDKIQIHRKICLTFTDNGNGMRPDKLHKMLSFGYCEKVPDGSHMPVGHYGNGFKSGSMRLGKDALVLTKQENSKSVGYLSQTYLDVIKADTVVVPIVTWDKKDDCYFLRPHGVNALNDILRYSLLKSEEQLNSEFDKIPGDHGTRIIISNIRTTTDQKPEFDFKTDEYDIRIPDDLNSESEKYRKTKRQNHVPECDYSLRAYCAILYLKPKMQIILRDKKVKTLVVEKSLSQTEVDKYKPTHFAIANPIKVVFGFNSRNKNHYGIMMYHRNRLIKPYERVGYQLKANNLGVGVVGVVQCDFLQPTHNKQDFDYTKAYRACIYSLGIKLNEYWNEKKGPARSQNNNSVDLSIPEPQEIHALPDQNWVQCDRPTCLKWRKIPDGIDPDSLPDKWYCENNPDPKFKSCDVPEEKEEETTCITPYQKTQKKRLVKEMEEKQRREKAEKLAAQREQEEMRKELEKKAEDLKKKEEDLKKKEKQMAQLTDIKPNIKVEGGSLPTAQVAPRPTTKPLNAVTPNAKTSTRQRDIGIGQLASRLAQTKQATPSTPQTNKSSSTPTKPSPSPVRSTPLPRVNQSPSSPTLSSQSSPRSALGSQSTPKSSLLNQSTSSTNTTNQSPSNKPSIQLTKTPTNRNLTFLQPKPTNAAPQTIKLVAPSQAQKLGTAGVTFKMVKAANGSTYLVQEKNPQIAAQGTKSTPGISSSQTQATNIIPARTSSSSTSVDVKPRLNVLPNPQVSARPSAEAINTNNRVQKIVVTTATANQQNAVSTPSYVKTVARSSSKTDVKPSHSMAATAYSEITGNTSTTPQDVKNILTSGIKREPPENLVSPIPAKVQRKKSDAAVIVIDPLPSETKNQKQRDSAAENRVKELEKRVEELENRAKEHESRAEDYENRAKEHENRAKTLENSLAEAKSDAKDKVNKMAIQLDEKSIQLTKRNKEIEEKTKEIRLKEIELKDKVRQLKVLRGNVCKLLQVLVPEIDVESEGDGETVDDLLKQVLEANK